MLNQVGGKDSDKNIYEMNTDGSELNKKTVQSSYSIKSPIIENGIITAKIGQMGYIEVGYGQMDKTSHKDALTQELETDHTYSTSREVKEEFKQEKGTDNIKEDIKKIKEYENYENLTEEETDKNNNRHIENIIEEIKQYGENIEEIFTDKEIEERLRKIKEKNPQDSIEKLIEKTKEELSEDAQHIKGHKLTQ